MVDIELLEVPSETVARVRAKVPMAQITDFFGPAFEQVMHAVPEAGGEVSGPPFGWYHGVPTDVVDVSAGFPVAGDVHLTDDTAVMSWMKEHSLEAREDMWEEYLSPPTGDPSTWRTRIVMPVR